MDMSHSNEAYLKGYLKVNIAAALPSFLFICLFTLSFIMLLRINLAPYSGQECAEEWRGINSLFFFLFVTFNFGVV